MLDNPPDPLNPGAMQELVVSHPPRATDVYASVRAVDGAGNISRVGALAHARVPGYTLEIVCTDVLTGLPLAGLDAVITLGASAENTVTDAAGSLHLSDLDDGTLTIALSSAGSSHHLFRASFALNADTLLQVPMIPVQQPQTNLYPSILSLLRVANLAVGGERVLKRWHSCPVQLYARDFVNVNGLDYRVLLQQAADRWNARLGFQMFAATGADPATGILVEFLPISTMGTVNGVMEYSNDARGYPVHDRIRIVDAMTDGPRLYSILLHELGHAIPFGHLPAGFIMFGSQPLPLDISDDEVAMVRLLLALPNGTDLNNYDPHLAPGLPQKENAFPSLRRSRCCGEKQHLMWNPCTRGEGRQAAFDQARALFASVYR